MNWCDRYLAINLAGLCLVMIGIMPHALPRDYPQTTPCVEEIDKFINGCTITLMIVGAILMLTDWSTLSNDLLLCAEYIFDAYSLCSVIVITASTARRCGTATNTKGYSHLLGGVYAQADAESVSATSFYAISAAAIISMLITLPIHGNRYFNSSQYGIRPGARHGATEV